MRMKRWISAVVCVVMLMGILTVGVSAATGLVSNIAQWDTATNIWTFTDAGLQGAGTNAGNAAFSSASTVEAGVPFIYEADMALTGRSGALLFGYTERAQPTKGFAVNIDRNQKKLRFFKFTDSQFNKDYGLTTEENNQASYHIKVTYDGMSVLKVYLDGELRIETSGITVPTGYVGVMAHYGTPTFNNIYLQKGNIALKSFEILTEGVTITPVFDPAVSIYGMDIAGGVDTVTLRPIKGEGVEKIYYTLKTREYKEVTKEKTEVTDTIILTKEDFVDNYVNMDLTMANADFERTITFRINKWFSPEELANQEYRSQFHITPQINFMNDPNGLVYDPTDGYWHVHYQYSPQTAIGQQSWAHVRSKDLVNWEQMPLALQVDDLGRMYSGSAISLTEAEAKNPAIYDGIFADNKEGESRLIAFYTNAGVDGKQRQCTAYSKDHGQTWIKYNGGKPIIDNDKSTSGVKFGDPKVFKIPGDDTHWYMVTIGLAQMFASEDLLNWTKVQDLYYANGETFEETPTGVIRSECPGMNPVTLEGSDEQKWIFSGADGFYVVGNMAKDETTGYYHWTAESARIKNESNFFVLGLNSSEQTFGKSAGMTFYEDGTGNGRTIGISWVHDNNMIGKSYNGYQSLPYEWKLKKNSSGEYIVINAPIEEINILHGEKLFSAKSITVGENENILNKTTAILFDLETVIDMGDAEEFGFVVRKGATQQLVLKYNATTQKLTLDCSKSIIKRQDGIWTKTVALENNKIKLRLIVDQGVAEAFANDGEAAISTASMIDIANIGMEFYVSGGSVTVESMDIYDMKSMYSGKTYAEKNGGTYYLSGPAQAMVGEQVQIGYFSYPYKESEKLTLEHDESLLQTKNEDGNFTLRPTKSGTFTLKLLDANGKVLNTKDLFVGKFETNIPEWQTLSGIWSITENGLYAAGTSASNAGFSSLTKIPQNTAFTYEASIKLEGRSAALLFGYPDASKPTSNAFGLNIDRTQKVVKMWDFRGGSQQPTVALTAEQLAQESYHLKLTYDGSSILTVYLDGTQVMKKAVNEVSTKIATLPAGYVGLMAHGGAPTFSNVYLYTSGTDVSVSEFAPIEVYEKSELGALEAQLADSAIVVQSDDIQRIEKITWDTNNLSTDVAGEFTLNGSVNNSALKAVQKIKIAHKWETEYTVDTEPSCGDVGSKSIHCELCDEKKEVTSIPATGEHGAGSIVPDIEPTCGKDGKAHSVCADCGSTVESNIVLPATGKHSYDKGVITTKPTTEKTGVKTFTCKTCGTSKTETVAKLPKEESKPKVSFTDVKKSDYYYDAVAWAVELGVTTGTSDTTFSPSASCTRAQAVTFLWRAAGSPAPKGNKNPFTDIKKSDYFYKAVLWAAENNVTSGMTSTTFAPNAVCTRGQIVTFLWRAQGGKKVAASNPFKDVKKSDYYYDAVLWAVKNNVTTGTAADKFSPDATCTRGQIVTFLYRAMD